MARATAASMSRWVSRCGGGLDESNSIRAPRAISIPAPTQEGDAQAGEGPPHSLPQDVPPWVAGAEAVRAWLGGMETVCSAA